LVLFVKVLFELIQILEVDTVDLQQAMHGELPRIRFQNVASGLKEPIELLVSGLLFHMTLPVGFVLLESNSQCPNDFTLQNLVHFDHFTFQVAQGPILEIVSERAGSIVVSVPNDGNNPMVSTDGIEKNVPVHFSFLG